MQNFTRSRFVLPHAPHAVLSAHNSSKRARPIGVGDVEDFDAADVLAVGQPDDDRDVLEPTARVVRSVLPDNIDTATTVPRQRAESFGVEVGGEIV